MDATDFTNLPRSTSSDQQNPDITRFVTIENVKKFHDQLIMISKTLHTYKKPTRYEKLMKNFVNPILNSTTFNHAYIVTSILQASLICLETFPEFTQIQQKTMKIAFYIGYVLIFFNFILHLIKNWKKITSFWMIIDMISLIYPLLPNYCQCIFIFRLIGIFPKTREFAKAFIATLPDVAVMSFLIGIFILVSSIIAVPLFSETSYYWYGSLRRSLTTIFLLMTQSGWLWSYKELIDAGVVTSTRVLYVFVLTIGGFVLMNAITGVSSQSIEAKNRHDEIEQMKEKKKILAEEKKNLRIHKLLTRKKSLEKIQKFGTLKVGNKTPVKDLEANIKEMNQKLSELQSLFSELDSLTEQVLENSFSSHELNT